MKRITALLLIGAMALSLTACTGSTATQETAPAEAETEETTDAGEIALDGEDGDAAPAEETAEEVTEAAAPAEAENKIEDTWEVIRSYGFNEKSESNLGFMLIDNTVKEYEEYYTVDVTLNKPVSVPTDVEDGETVEVVVNDLTGEKLTLRKQVQNDYGKDFIYINEYDEIYFPVGTDGKGGCYVVYESDDRLESPFYEGTIMVAKDALIRIEILDSTEPVSKENLNGYYNGVIYEDAKVVRNLVFYGD